MTDQPSRPLTRAERRRQETRAKLLQATRSLLHEKGYASLKVQAITERADLGYGTFYVHFADKDEAVWEATLEDMQAVMQAMHSNAATLPSPQRELYGWYVTFHGVAQVRELFLEIFGRNGSPALLNRYQELMAQTYRTGADGLYHNPHNLPLDVQAQYAAGATVRLLIWWLEEQPNYSAAEMAAMLFELFYREKAPDMPELN